MDINGQTQTKTDRSRHKRTETHGILQKQTETDRNRLKPTEMDRNGQKPDRNRQKLKDLVKFRQLYPSLAK